MGVRRSDEARMGRAELGRAPGQSGRKAQLELSMTEFLAQVNAKTTVPLTEMGSARMGQGWAVS